MCVVNLAVTYSPLCDTDKTVYQEYLQAVKDALRVCEGRVAGGCFGRLVGDCNRSLERGGKEVAGGQRQEPLRLGGGVWATGDAGDVGCARENGRYGEEAGVVFGVHESCHGRFGEVGTESCFGGSSAGQEHDVLCAGEELEKGFVKGKNWKKNQRKKLNRRGRVNADAGPGLGLSSGSVNGAEINVDTGSQFVKQSVVEFSGKPKDALRLSLEKKWALENELKAAKAARELELLKAEDLDAVKKLRERKVQGATERTMVQIEKAHASLVQTGNVPGVQPGFCQTVVDGEVVESVPGLSSGESKECSISPSSSISEREVRNMMKELEDLKEKVRKYERKEGLEERVGKMYAESVPVTLDSEECVPEDIVVLAGDRFEGPEFFKYGKIFEKDDKKYRTMKFDAEGYSYSGRENWCG